MFTENLLEDAGFYDCRHRGLCIVAPGGLFGPDEGEIEEYRRNSHAAEDEGEG
jgi:hypothetical protein